MKTKRIIILIIGVLLMNLTSCGSLARDTASKTVNALEKKYGCKFEAKKIGDRLYNTTATVYLKDEEGVFFTAYISSDDHAVEDNYVRRKVAYNVQKDIIKELEQYSVKAGIDVGFACQGDLKDEKNFSIGIKDFIEKYQAEDVLLYICIKDTENKSDDIKKIITVLRKYSKDFGIPISSAVFEIPESVFEECVNGMSENPELNTTWFLSYTEKKSVMFNIDGENANPDEAEIIAQLLED